MAEQRPEVRLTEPRMLRALAHPLRLRLLGLLRLGGPATATDLAGEVGEAISLISYHLRQLHSHGFIEPAPELARDGRERWWRASHEYTQFIAADFLDTPERRAAGRLYLNEVLRVYSDAIEQYLAEEPAWGEEWTRASTHSDFAVDLSPDELTALKGELRKTVEGAGERAEAVEGDGVRREKVRVIVHAFPVRRPGRNPQDEM